MIYIEGVSQGGTSTIQGGSGTIVLAGITARDWNYSDNAGAYADAKRSITFGGANAACTTETLVYDWTATSMLNKGTKKFTSVTASVTSTTTRSRHSTYENITFTIVPTVDIPENGEIQLTMEGTW